jgi:predicted naringenin-chalcone synthase
MVNKAPGIIAIGTAVPERALSQSEVGEAVLKALPDEPGRGARRIRQFVKRIYRTSGVDKRHTVLSTFPASGPDGCFIPDTPCEYSGPSTSERNEIYRREAALLAVRAAKNALKNAGDIQGKKITHLVTASCTGFYAPGLEIELIRMLNLSGNIARIHIGFMGCYAALPALRVAQALVLAEPDARALVVCTELCSLHYQHSFDPEIVLANSLFADGAAAAVVGSYQKTAAQFLSLKTFGSQLSTDTLDKMQWIIGDHGFDMVLSQEIPNHIGTWLPSCFIDCCLKAGVAPEKVDSFAIHPGGRAILDNSSKALGCTKTDLAASYDVLRSFGNMSSATLLFVLDQLMKSSISSKLLFAAAFGPGLCAETAIMEVL